MKDREERTGGKPTVNPKQTPVVGNFFGQQGQGNFNRPGGGRGGPQGGGGFKKQFGTNGAPQHGSRQGFKHGASLWKSLDPIGFPSLSSPPVVRRISR